MIDLNLPRTGGRPERAASRGRGQTGWSKGPFAGVLVGGLVVAVFCFMLAGVAQALEEPHPAVVSLAKPVSYTTFRHPREKTFIKRKWGIEILYVRRTAAGYMLEFRYKVLDEKKAKPLFERRIKPVLIHAETGAKLIVPTPPKTGALRNSYPPIAGRTYWMFFANPGKLVKPGEHVRIEIGEFRAEGLVVQ